MLRLRRFGRSGGTMLIGAMLATACAVPAWGQANTARFKPMKVNVTPVSLVASFPGEGPVPRGDCPDSISTHTDANFGGGAFVVQGGFAQMEIAAAQYTIPAAAFPIKLNLAEMIFATSSSSQQTTTQWGIRVWSGPPNTGTLVAAYDSDGTILPHIVIPQGTNGVNVQVSVDPGDPEQIIIDAPADGSRSFTVGYIINQHNQQTQNPCLVSPPTCCNAFPTTDTSGLQQPANNWLFGVNCGSFGCPPNGGWARFSQLASFCRPSGDWVIRVTWESVNCNPTVGACCLPAGNCIIASSTDCSNQGGTYQGDNVTCGSVNCPQPVMGACCLPSGVCEQRTQSSCQASSGTYQGNNTLCANVNCPQPARACCFQSTGGCLNLTPSNCTTAGGVPGPVGSLCATYVCFPMGACCLPNGNCVGPVSPAGCQSQGGTFQGNATTCANTNCPQPTGACCFTNGNCLQFTSSECSTAGGTYQGNGTTCGPTTCAPPTGRCCFPNGACLDFTAEDCATAGGTFGGVGSMCSSGPCAPACPCDWNHAGGVNSQDYFDFLTAFFAGNADFNGDLMTTSQDFFDFIVCFFQPPSGC